MQYIPDVRYHPGTLWDIVASVLIIALSNVRDTFSESDKAINDPKSSPYR